MQPTISNSSPSVVGFGESTVPSVHSCLQIDRDRWGVDFFQSVSRVSKEALHDRLHRLEPVLLTPLPSQLQERRFLSQYKS